MGCEDVDFLERVAVDQPRDALARGELVLGVLAVESFGVAVARLVLPLPQLIERVDLVALRRAAHSGPMNIHRWPSTSSTRYPLAPSSRTSSDRVRAPALRRPP